MSLGKSAELSGLTTWDFIEFLGENNVAVIDYSEEQPYRELDNRPYWSRQDRENRAT